MFVLFSTKSRLTSRKLPTHFNGLSSKLDKKITEKKLELDGWFVVDGAHILAVVAWVRLGFST